jgi:carboxyl-terminal processing protease
MRVQKSDSDSEEQPTEAQRLKQTKHRLQWLAKTLGVGIAIVLIFEFGVGVGNGKIVFDSNKSEQTDAPSHLNYSSVNQLYQSLKQNYDGKLDETKLLDGMKAGLTSAAGDPYTEYFSPKDAQAFNDQLSGTFTGIGAELGKDAAGNLIVVAPISDFPADKAGVRAQDVIASIDGKSTTGMSTDEAVTHIRGPKDTKVALKIVRQKTQELTITITRDNIKIPSVKSQILDGNIGYLQITQFSDDTASLAHKAADDFKSKNVKGVVLDMRDDPGGLLDAAVDVSSMWLPEGKTVLQEKRGGTVVHTYEATGDNPLKGIPTVVLINEGSASASEITAGALRDNNVATLVGVKSYGKGSVQQVQPLSDGAELKVTIARWFRPNGQNIDKKGITPDKEVKMSDDDYKNQRDPQKDAAIANLLGQ